MSKKKNLLFVTDVCPYPLDRGQRVRVHNLLAACGRAGEVTFVGPAPERRSDRDQVEQHCARALYLEESPADLNGLSMVARTARLGPGLPRPSMIRRYSPFFALLGGLDVSQFDLIWAERLHVASVCPRAPSRTILDLDDLEHVKLARTIGVTRKPLPLAQGLYRYAIYRQHELSRSKRFLASVVCSEEDRAYLTLRGCHNVVTVPNGTNVPLSTDARPASMRDPQAPLRVVFLGHMQYPSNVDAVDYFAGEVVPLLRVQRPEATFDVIGLGASQEMAERHASRVRFRGFVDDLGAALGEYDVFVAPMRIGSGTKIKVLDAMAHRIPVVTTGVGAEGLSLTHGENALFAETPAALAEGIVRIKEDPALADRLASSALALARERFSWSSIQDRLVDWLQALAPSGPRPR